MGIKAKKVKLSAKGQRIIRRESRWLRRLIRSHRRFMRFAQKHTISEYGSAETIISIIVKPRSARLWNDSVEFEERIPARMALL